MSDTDSSENTDNTETVITDAAEPEQPEPEPEQPDTKEAARYRRKLREAEKQRDDLAARVEALQRQHAESLLASSNVKPEAVWAVADLTELLAEDGTVDADKLHAAVATAREKFGIAKPAKGTVVPGVGNQPSVAPKADAWREAFAPTR